MKKKEEEEDKRLEALRDQNDELEYYARMIEKTIVVVPAKEEDKASEPYQDSHEESNEEQELELDQMLQDAK